MQDLMPEMDELIFLSDARYISAQFRSDLKEIVSKNFPELEIKGLRCWCNDYRCIGGFIGAMQRQTAEFSFAHGIRIQKGNVVLTQLISSRILSYYSSSPHSLDTGLQRGTAW